MTHSYASAAENAKIVVSLEERIPAMDLLIFVKGRKMKVVRMQIFDHSLQAAAAVILAKNAARHLADFADRGFVVLARLFFPADEACARMFGEDEFEDVQAHLLKGGRIRDDVHAVLDGGPAGRDHAPAPPNLDDTEAAAAERNKAGMIAERRDIDAVLAGDVEDGFPDFDV